MTSLAEALGGVTREDLLDYLDRYGHRSREEYAALYPSLTLPLVRAALGAADECPVCLHRFLRLFPLGGGHAPGCVLNAWVGRHYFDSAVSVCQERDRNLREADRCELGSVNRRRYLNAARLCERYVAGLAAELEATP